MDQDDREPVTITAADVGTMPASVIVEAVGIAVHSENEGLAARMEAAMSAAVHQAIADGIPLSDSDAIRERMMAACEDVLLAG